MSNPNKKITCHAKIATILLAGILPLLGGCVTRSMESPIVSENFAYDTGPYPSVHASTIAETDDGELVAAWFGGTKERNPDVCIWVSRFEDGQWTPSIEAANGIDEDGTRYPTWNPVLFQAPGGDLLLFYKVGPSPGSWWGMVKRSSDGGRTWSRAERLPGDLVGPVKNKPVVLWNGNWLSPSSTEGKYDGWQAHVELSRDKGKTWEFIGPIDKGIGFDSIQPSILIHPDGILEMLCRSKQGSVTMSWSYDGGETWSEMAATELTNPNSGTDAVTLQDGRQLIVYNPTGHRPDRSGKGLRYPLSVAVSDDGLIWTRVLDLDTEPCPAGYAYPAVIQTRDGMVHITYTWNRDKIKHVVLDPALIP